LELLLSAALLRRAPRAVITAGRRDSGRYYHRRWHPQQHRLRCGSTVAPPVLPQRLRCRQCCGAATRRAGSPCCGCTSVGMALSPREVLCGRSVHAAMIQAQYGTMWRRASRLLTTRPPRTCPRPATSTRTSPHPARRGSSAKTPPTARTVAFLATSLRVRPPRAVKWSALRRHPEPRQQLRASTRLAALVTLQVARQAARRPAWVVVVRVVG